MAEAAINGFYEAFCQYMTETYDATSDQLMLDWNCVGATSRFHSRYRTIEIRLWEHSEGCYSLPDMTAIIHVCGICELFIGRQKEVDVFISWIREAAKESGFRYLACEDQPPIPEHPDQVAGCEIACTTL